MSRLEVDLVDVLRLEIQTPGAGLANLIVNPDGSLGGWGWRSPQAGTWVTGGSALTFHTTGYNPTPGTGNDAVPFFSDRAELTPGDYVQFSVEVTPGNDLPIVPQIEFYNDAGGLISRTLQADVVTAGIGGARAELDTPKVVPAGTVTASLRLLVVSDDLSPGDIAEILPAIMCTAATSGELADLPGDVTPATWTNIISPAVSINTARAPLDAGTLDAEILDASLDPGVSPLIRSGTPIRLTTLIGAIWEPIFTGQIDEGEVAYDLSRTDNKRARITLTASDANADLASVTGDAGVSLIPDLSQVLEGLGVPWLLDGSADQAEDATVIVTSDKSAVIEQLAVTRDMNLGYVWVDRAGVLRGQTDRDGDFYGDAGVLDETDYADPVVGFSASEVINEVTVTVLQNDADTGGLVEIDYGPFINYTSRRQWRPRAAAFRVYGADGDVDQAENVAEFAALILAANANPGRTVSSLRVPIRNQAEIDAHALTDLYAQRNFINTDAAMDVDLRVFSVKHSIESDRWSMELGFRNTGTVASPRTSSSGTSGGGASGGIPGPPGPDNIISIVPGPGIGVDDSDPHNPVVSADGASAAATKFENTDTHTATATGDQTFPLSFIPTPGSLHIRWGPLDVPASFLSVDTDGVVTIDDPDNFIHVGDLFTAAYAHSGGVPVPGAVPVLDFGHAGWKWLQIGRTTATDYSAAAFDDSAWASAAGPFGESNPSGYISGLTGWPAEATVWGQNTRMWARRTFAATPGDPLTITTRLNKYVTVYLNGVAMFSDTCDSTQQSHVIDGADVLASNVLAVRVTDENFSGAGTGCYFDLRIDQ